MTSLLVGDVERDPIEFGKLSSAVSQINLLLLSISADGVPEFGNYPAFAVPQLPANLSIY